MQEVGHDVLGQRALLLGKLRADIEVFDALAVVEFGDLLIDRRDLLADRRAGLGAAREDAQQQHLGLRRTVAEFGDDGLDALGNLLGAVAAGVVRADHQYGELRLDAFEFAIADAPQDVLGAVATDAEVGGLERGEVLLPGRLGGAAAPGVRDRVAQEKQVHIALLGDGHETFVPFHPTGIWLATFSRCAATGSPPGSSSPPPCCRRTPTAPSRRRRVPATTVQPCYDTSYRLLSP